MQNERIVVFEAVLRTGSLSAAARDLQLSQPTVRCTIEALEIELADSLFTRSDNGLIPTRKAHDLWPTAKAVVETSYAFYRAAASDPRTVAGTVRVSSSRVVSHFVLPRMLAELRIRHPNLKVELVPDDRSTDLLRRDADIAIRHVAPKQLQLVARKVGSIELGLFSKAEVGETDIISCLKNQPFVWEDRSVILATAAEDLNLPRPSKIAVATDDQALQVALFAAGVGMGICQVPIAEDLSLNRAVHEWRLDLPVSVIAHEDQINSPSVRQTFDFFAAKFA